MAKGGSRFDFNATIKMHIRRDKHNLKAYTFCCGSGMRKRHENNENLIKANGAIYNAFFRQTKRQNTTTETWTHTNCFRVITQWAVGSGQML